MPEFTVSRSSSLSLSRRTATFTSETLTSAALFYHNNLNNESWTIRYFLARPSSALLLSSFRGTLHDRRLARVTSPGLATPGSMKCAAQVFSGRGPCIDDARAFNLSCRPTAGQSPMRSACYAVSSRITPTVTSTSPSPTIHAPLD